MANETANQAPVAVVEGPNGKAEIFEIMVDNRSIEYQVRFKGRTERYKALGEAYITAGELAGVKT
ncbi:MAG TPA: hypothetical protein VII57_05920 [Dehalococcoidia bacterium]